MKLFLTITLALLLTIDPGKIGKINSLKSEAKAAFQAGDYKTAIAKYRYLIDTLGVTEDEVSMNLAHAYFKANDTLNATQSYMPLTLSNDRRIKSLANQQLGVLNTRENKLEAAVNYFKQAVKAAPENEDARYNYELVKKKLEEQKKKEQQNQDKKNQDPNNKDQNKNEQQKKEQDKKEQEKKEQEKKEQEKKEQQEKQKQEQDKKDGKKDKEDQNKKDQEQKDQKEKDKKPTEKSEQDKKQEKGKEIPPDVKQKLEKMQISEETAKMILEAMKNQETQYLQQNKRKGVKPKDRNKPDW